MYGWFACIYIYVSSLVHTEARRMYRIPWNPDHIEEYLELLAAEPSPQIPAGYNLLSTWHKLEAAEKKEP